MSETATDPKPPETDAEPAERSVPYSRFKEVNDKARERERRIAELEAKMEELADRDKPDIERLTKQVEKLQAERDQARQDAERVQSEAQKAQRRSLVSEAAAKLDFRNPGDASLFVNLDEIEDASAAEKALKQVVKEREYLVKPKQPDPRGLERVGAGGEVDKEGRPVMVTPEEQARMHGAEIWERFKQIGAVPAD